jgi:hypothetical protein
MVLLKADWFGKPLSATVGEGVETPAENQLSLIESEHHRVQTNAPA